MRPLQVVISSMLLVLFSGAGSLGLASGAGAASTSTKQPPGSAPALKTASVHPLKIGVLLPLSGAVASFGEIARRGTELALAELPPKDRARVQVVFEDDGMVSTRSAAAARKLIDIDKVDALVSWSSGSGLTVAGIAESKRIPHISVASDPNIVQGRRYSFTYWPLPETEAEALVRFLVSKKVRRVALVSLTHAGVLAIRDAFIRRAAEGGEIRVVADEEVLGDLTDFRGVLQRIKSRGEIDGFLPILFPGQLAECIKQARALGISAPLYGFDTFEDRDEIRNSNGLLKGGIYATGADPTAEFIAAYKRRYPNESYYTANQSYDAVRLLVEATEAKSSADAVVTFLQGLKDHPTASGRISSTGDNRFKLPVAVKRIGAEGLPEIVE